MNLFVITQGEMAGCLFGIVMMLIRGKLEY